VYGVLPREGRSRGVMKICRSACLSWARHGRPLAEPPEWTRARELAREIDDYRARVRANDVRYASFSLVDYEENLIQTQTNETQPKPKRTLFEIIDQVQEILARAHQAAGELTDADVAELDALDLSIEEKAEAYAAVYRMRREEGEACKRMAKRYEERAVSKTREADSIKRRLYEGMQMLGRQKIETATATAYVQKSPAALEILVPEDQIPAQYIELRRHVRKDEIKADLQGGLELPFARLTVGSHLRIR
jgi:hypothetical protein